MAKIKTRGLKLCCSCGSNKNVIFTQDWFTMEYIYMCVECIKELEESFSTTEQKNG